MMIDKIENDATIIKFYDDYIVDENKEIIKKELDIMVVSAIKKLVNKG